MRCWMHCGHAYMCACVYTCVCVFVCLCPPAFVCTCPTRYAVYSMRDTHTIDNPTNTHTLSSLCRPLGTAAVLCVPICPDMPAVSIFLPTADARASAAAGEWRGGVNYTALRLAEDRAYGWFHAMQVKVPDVQSRLILNRSATYSNTTHGLSKFPYLRDTRRAIGPSGFRLTTSGMKAGSGHPHTGPRWNDTIGLGGCEWCGLELVA